VRREHKETKVHKEIRVSKETKVSKEILDPQRHRVLKGHHLKDLRDLRVIRQKELKVISETPHKVLREVRVLKV
jgi:hypothetical protein